MGLITHLLDTSAVLAHYFQVPGAQVVHSLLLEHPGRLGLSVVSVPELAWRLAAHLGDPRESERALKVYIEELTQSVALTREMADASVRLQRATASSLPLVRALIAGTAQARNAMLVYCDPRFDAIPDALVKKLRLPSTE